MTGVVLILGLVVAGCGDDNDGRVGISGEVRLRGEPLNTGRIRLTPDTNSQGPIAWGTIEHGRYDIPRADGPVPGTYRVTILPGPSSRSKEAGFRELRASKPSGKATQAAPGQSSDINWPTPVVLEPGKSHYTLNIPLPGT